MPYLLKNIHSSISNSNMHHSKRRLFNIKQQKISANQPVFLHVCLSTLVFCSVHHQRVVLCQTTSHCLKMKSLELLCANKLRKNVIASSDFNRFMVWMSQVVPFMVVQFLFFIQFYFAHGKKDFIFTRKTSTISLQCIMAIKSNYLFDKLLYYCFCLSIWMDWNDQIFQILLHYSGDKSFYKNTYTIEWPICFAKGLEWSEFGSAFYWFFICTIFFLCKYSIWIRTTKSLVFWYVKSMLLHWSL